MDCPSEIKLIETLFEANENIHQLKFDLDNRSVTFFHTTESSSILSKLASIKLPGDLIDSKEILEDEVEKSEPSVESQTLKMLLLINFGMFIFEIIMGIVSQSTGLIADSIDMLADSLVYGISLFAVNKAIKAKSRAAFLSGVFQMTLAIGCIIEVVRRFFYGSEPLSSMMIGVSIIALIANIICLALIHKHKDGGIHMKASWIFSANDVIANLGVITAGSFVYFTNSRYPDLIIGALIAFIVFSGSIRILRLAKETDS